MPQNALASLRETMPKDNGLQPGRKVRVTPEARNALASMGRRGDTRLAHVTKREMNLLKRLGGSGTRHPETGMPEYFAGPSGSGAVGGGGTGAGPGAGEPGGAPGGGAAAGGAAGGGAAGSPAGGPGGAGLGGPGAMGGVGAGPSVGGSPVGGGFGPAAGISGASAMGGPVGAGLGGMGAPGFGAQDNGLGMDTTDVALDMGPLGNITEQDMALGVATAALGKGVMSGMHGLAGMVGEGISAAEDAVGVQGMTDPSTGVGGTASSAGRGEGARIGSTFRAQNPDLYGGGVRVGSTRPGVQSPDLGGMNTLRGLVEQYG